MFADLRFAIRSLGKTPAFAMTAIAALAIGIGAVTAIFSVVNAVLLRPLPYADPDRIVMIWENNLPRGIQQFRVSPANLRDWAAAQRSFSSIAHYYEDQATLTGAGEPERVEGATVSPGLFATLGVKPAAGRELTGEEATAGHTVAVLSHGLWQRRFGGRAEVLDSDISINGQNHRVVGILPAGFRLFDSPAELFRPHVITDKDLQQRGTHTLKAFGRLAAGVSLTQAQAEMSSLGRSLEEKYPEWNRGWNVFLRLANDEITGGVKPTLLILLGAVGLVLAIACANVANLLLVRAAERQKEIAIRTAIGASPWAIARQLLIESVVIALAAGVVGLGLGWTLLRLLGALAAGSLPTGTDIEPDFIVVAFAIAVAALTGLLFGLAPALTAARTDLNTVLRASGRGMVGSKAQAALRIGLAVAEIALSVLLLTGAALLVRSFLALENIDPGFRAVRVLTFRYSLPKQRYNGPEVPRFHQRFLDRVRALPGVEQAGATRDVPMSGENPSLNFQIEGRPVGNASDDPTARVRVATAGYLEAMGMRLKAGRPLEAGDTAEGRPPGVVVNAMLVKQYFGNENAIGRRIRSGFDNSPWVSIVGVVEDVRHRGPATDAQPEIYYSPWAWPVDYLGFTQATVTIAVRAAGDPRALVPAIRNELRGLDSSIAVFQVRTMDEVREAAVAQPRFRTTLLGAFAALALALAVIGLYGLISYSVSQRMQEMSVRSALGAAGSDLVSLVMGEGMKLALVGVAIGLVAAFFLARLLGQILFGVEPFDAVSFAAASAVVVVIAALASLVPALRASRANPAEVLRGE